MPLALFWFCWFSIVSSNPYKPEYFRRSLPGLPKLLNKGGASIYIVNNVSRKTQLFMPDPRVFTGFAIDIFTEYVIKNIDRRMNQRKALLWKPFIKRWSIYSVT